VNTIEDLCLKFKTLFSYEYRLVLLELLFLIASSDYVVSESEKEFLNKVSILLEISPQDFQRFYHPDSPDSDTAYYELLGLKPGCSLDELKKAYKTACKAFHPDKVQHLGEEVRKVAEDKLKKINQAYEYLKKQLS